MSDARPLTMTPESERDLRRYAGSNNARYVLDKVWPELDATRSRLAQMEADLALVREQEEVASGFYAETFLDLAHSQARERQLREALVEIAASLGPPCKDNKCDGCRFEMDNALKVAEQAALSAPSGEEALTELCERVALAAIQNANAVFEQSSQSALDTPRACAIIVQSVLHPQQEAGRGGL